MTVKIGDVVKIKTIPTDTGDSDVVCRTPSVYSYGFSLVLSPNESHEYVVCKGTAESGFLLAQKDDSEAPIGFALVYQDNKPNVVITQVGFVPEPVELVVVGEVDPTTIPNVYQIGSQLLVARDNGLSYI
jgi:hypothetical protein